MFGRSEPGQMPVYPFEGHSPQISPGALVVPNATLIGRVRLADQVSVWFNAVLRGDNDDIVVGARSNIQDGCVIHVDAGKPCHIGEDCVVGHQAMLHGCRLGNRVLVGIGAVVLNDAVLADDLIVAAGSLVPERARLESGKLYLGTPAKPVRDLKPEELDRIRYGAAHYVEKIEKYRAIF